MPTSRPDRSLLILFSVVALDLIGFGIVVPILPFYADQFGASATVLGFLLTSYLGLSFAFVPGSPSVPLLLLPLAFASCGRGVCQPSLMSLVSKKSPAHLRGAVMGTFQASANLARVVGPVIAGLLYDQWQASPFLLAAGLMLVVFFSAIGI